MNEQYKKNIKNHEKQLSDLLRKRDKTAQIKKIDDTINLKGINRKIQEHQVKINEQKQQLTAMN